MRKLLIRKYKKYIIKNPPKGTDIKHYELKRGFKPLTCDEGFVLNVLLEEHDIAIFVSELANGSLSAYCISEFEKAKERVLREEQERQYLEDNFDAFVAFLKDRGEYMSDHDARRAILGNPLTARDGELYRAYLCSGYRQKMKGGNISGNKQD